MGRSAAPSITASLKEAAEQFLTLKRICDCTEATIRTYQWWLETFIRFVGSTAADITPLVVLKFFASLKERKLSESYREQAYRTLRTWFKWGLDAGVFHENYIGGFKMRKPKPLPDIPTVEEVRSVLRACRGLPTEARNRAIMFVLMDTGIRNSELCHLLVEHWRPAEQVIFIRGGKGRKDRTVPFGSTTMRAVRKYLMTRSRVDPSDYLFVSSKGEGAGEASLKRRNLDRILERLSKRAGLAEKRYVYPHALRGFGTTAWLRNKVGLDQVRRLLGHESLHTTLRYSRLVSADLQEAHRQASAIERMTLE